MKQGIILAAGLGSRLRNITKNTPKSLIQINKKPIIEKNIEYMIEAGVDRIIVVIGYMREKFEYLEKKYENANLVLVYNEDFDSSNTVSSMFCAKKYLDCETYITTADILLRENLFKNIMLHIAFIY